MTDPHPAFLMGPMITVATDVTKQPILQDGTKLVTNFNTEKTDRSTVLTRTYHDQV